MERILELQERLARYEAARYPVQHATVRFHLGVALADAGRADEAIESLTSAVELFDAGVLPVEHAKALNALGAARRLVGDGERAGLAFERAAELFEGRGLDPEHGATLFNLGLVRRERDAPAAVSCFRRAAALLSAEHEAAAVRELGATLLELGEFDEATRTLERAVELAERGGDVAGLGGALNALGLAQLAGARPDGAAESFRTAAGAHPRSVRPAEFAMAKANLALAHEQRGDAPRARLAARQALGVADAPSPVTAQAHAVLERLGPGSDDLLEVLRMEPQERMEGVVREELARSAEAAPAERVLDASTWIDGSGELAEVWLGGLLELPPQGMELLVRSTLQALSSRPREVQERFRTHVSRAAATFHVPQLLRIEEIFRRSAEELGQQWS